MVSTANVDFMTVWICRACGVEHADTAEPPVSCVICTDERQYVPKTGQAWTTLAELVAEGTHIELEELEPNLFEVTAVPQVAIGQRCYLVRSTSGNLLWDPPGFVDEAAARRIRELGEVVAIVASHPHMYGVQVEWSRALGGAPVLVAASDARWVQRPDAAISTISADLELVQGLTIRTIGGHFPGSLIAHWSDGADGRGVVLSGDTFFPGPDGHWCTFMRSFPQYLPMSAAVVERVATAITARPFDRAYGNLGGVIDHDARAAVRRSAVRYAEWVRGDHDDLT
ncbi:MAG: Hydrolase [Microbacteriaceae bacterium]|nr:Hydrolase [Microbacteriaceae bacterium]